LLLRLSAPGTLSRTVRPVKTLHRLGDTIPYRSVVYRLQSIRSRARRGNRKPPPWWCGACRRVSSTTVIPVALVMEALSPVVGREAPPARRPPCLSSIWGEQWSNGVGPRVGEVGGGHDTPTWGGRRPPPLSSTAEGVGLPPPLRVKRDNASA
jgi:hypothetical protein